MIKRETETREYIIKETYYCDDCKSIIEREGTNVYPIVYQCLMCNKELCKFCKIDGDYYGSAREYFCENCWDNGKEFREQIDGLRKKW
jgi:hypothetical protein